MKTKNKQASARVVPTDDRNEFIRLRRSTMNEREPGASGAPESSLKFKKIQKAYFPKVQPFLPEVPIESPASAGDEEKKSKKNRKSGGDRTKPKSSKKSRRGVADASLLAAEGSEEEKSLDFGERHEDAVLESFDAEGAPEGVVMDEAEVGDNVAAEFNDLALDGQADERSDSTGLAEALAEAVDEEGLTFVEPAEVLPAETRAYWHRARGIVASKLMPIKLEDRVSFIKDIKSVSFKRWHLKPMVSSKIRKLALRDLRDVFAVKKVDAETLLQMSQVAYAKYVSGPGEAAVEHFDVAFAIGQVHFWGEERPVELGLWLPHEDIPALDFDEANQVVFSSDSSGSEDDEREAASPVVQRAALHSKSNSSHLVNSVPAARLAASKAPSTPKAVRLPGAGTPPALTKVKVPVVSQIVEESLSYAESLARDLSHKCRVSPDRTTPQSDHALLRAIDTIRKTLPASLADAAVDGLLRANDKLRGESAVKKNVVAEATPASASKLGRSYRLGALDQEQRAFAGRCGAVAARWNSLDAPEGERALFVSDRKALFNSGDREILEQLPVSLRKVVNGEEYANLNAHQKLRVMGRAIRRQIHEEKVASISRSKRGIADGDGGDGDDSPGDSCSDSTDSRKSSETYEHDSFCASDSEKSGRSDEGHSSDSEGDEDRAKRRENSNNSLGTPTPKKKADAGSAVVSATSNRDGPSLVLLGDEDLPLWKSGPARFKQGFHWESYLHHKQQYDNYKAHRGRYSDRTFKSVIDSKLVPAVCASCGFRRSSWADLPDHRLILRLERVLRPSRSTDFAMELKKIQLEQWGDEPLQTSYSTFAEKFLGKVAEAADAGRPVNSVVIKAAYKKAVEVEVPLKTWLEGVKWRGVDHAHQRLLRKLREARSWEAMSKTVSGGRARRAAPRADEEDGGADQQGAGKNRFKPKQRGRVNFARGRRGRGAGRKAKANNTGGKFQGKAPGGRGGDARPGPKAEKLRTWRGYDQRGESWHSDKDLFECFKKPCNAMFCQRCARHGHTADYCRVPDGTDGLNQSGYFQDARPGKAGPKRPPARNNSSHGRPRDDDGSGDDGSEAASDCQNGHGDDGDSQRGNGLTRRNNSTGRGRQGRGGL